MGTIILLYLFGISGFGQDIHFSQFNTAPLNQNPALAGVNFDFTVNVNYKDQWRSVGSPYKTIGASVDSKLNKKRAEKGYFCGGINFFADRAGDSNMGSTQANLTLVYQVIVAEYQTLGSGVQAGFAQRSVDYNNLTWGNQYNGFSHDATLPTGESYGSSSFTHPDFAAGVAWAYNNTSGLINVTDNHDLKFNAGFSVYHFSKPKYSFLGQSDRLYMRFVLHGNGLISISDTRMAVVPGFMAYKQGKTKEILFGSLFRVKLQPDSKYTGYKNGSALSFGGYYRTRDAFIAQMLFEFHQFAIGLSYDVNTSSLNAATNARGGFEVSLRFTNPNPFLDGRPNSYSKFD